ncbi:MAG: T9SS type A sorting domain-containing protein [Crocinitomicaceae bacterium]|nr:T9SS type A sorting domain-containing protein [Crocinitomicaceae bacterium]
MNSNAVATLNNMTVSQMGHTFDVQVEQMSEERVQISVVNMLGQNEVYSSYLQFQNGSNIFTLPADLQGVHLLVIRIGDSVITKKVVL